MSPPSRQDIRTQLRQGACQLSQVGKRLKTRFAPVDRYWSEPPPDHEPSITADYGMCCAWHLERSYRPVPMARESLDDRTWSAMKAAYIAKHLGPLGRE
jgi:hypothetical protein